jgi:hypothetical protein
VFFEIHGDTTSPRIEFYDFVIGDIAESYDLRDTITEIDDCARVHTIRREFDRVDLSFEFFYQIGSEIDSRVGHRSSD